MDAAAEIGRNHVSKRSARFSLGVENEQADAGRNGRTRLARPNSPARTGTGENLVLIFILIVQLTTNWQYLSLPG